MTINIYSCHLCKTTFESNNKLHQHIQTTHDKIKKVKLIILSMKSELKLVTVTTLSSSSAEVIVVESDALNIVEEAECEF